mmetsp:Transcript_23110/g.54636  ORF Transcript_23110/g.54636 Transcript_23110/m.54636 type:complete len:99 (-) Transcript_23110:128-424(-)
MKHNLRGPWGIESNRSGRRSKASSVAPESNESTGWTKHRPLGRHGCLCCRQRLLAVGPLFVKVMDLLVHEELKQAYLLYFEATDILKQQYQCSDTTVI